MYLQKIAERQAGRPENMVKLISLLIQDGVPTQSKFEVAFLKALEEYVYTKRIWEIYTRTGRRLAGTPHSHCGSLSVAAAREAYFAAEDAWRKAEGIQPSQIARLKRLAGSRFQGLLSKKCNPTSEAR